MCAFPYLPLPVLVMPTSVFLASSIVISFTMATLSALCLEPSTMTSPAHSDEGLAEFDDITGSLPTGPALSDDDVSPMQGGTQVCERVSVCVTTATYHARAQTRTLPHDHTRTCIN